MKKKITSLKIVLGVIAVFALTQASQSAQGEQKTLRFQTLASHSLGAVSDKKTLVIKEQHEWVNLWQALYADTSPAPEIPVVNFNRKMVIAVFAGDKPSSGHQIVISGLVKIGGQLTMGFINSFDLIL
jgi:hypothetical protein